MLRWILVVVALALSACAAPTKQTRDLIGADIAPRTLLRDVAFIDQTEGHCGPSVLTMAMNHAGRPVRVGDMAPQVMTGPRRGSLPMDLVSAARRNGMTAVRIEGLTNVAREIEAGHPVLVFQNLGLSWWPRWHFALATGYNLSEQEIVLHSGRRSFVAEPLNRFERSWVLADGWALVVLKPDELAATATELEHLRSASGLEQAGQRLEAQAAYEAMLKRWPRSLGALIGSGNTHFAGGDVKRAVARLKAATEFYPDSVVARHNLDVAQSYLK